MRGQGIAVAAFCCLLTLAASAWTQVLSATPSEVLANADRFDRQAVIVTGVVTNVQERVSRAGNPYYTVDLSDGNQAIRVFSFGKVPCRSGGATVEGTFAKIKQQGRYTFYNEVTATRVTCR
jgi:DNA polymerase III alpha subunit